ncbi:glycosyltransferase [Spirochaetales bacterium NM-380-WT-3C1]|uniref:Glycosyltransferase n=1 Tax=Bullifex porci TaxID=2606638 RepID=A0A7X2TPL9_9SPIO|nr:glycosyltransferase [Bullifex porci]MSU05586.1 glycosyltransferase [Bullifex porci]
MKILMINVSCGTGSTGRICTDLADALEKNGHIVKIAYGRDAVAQRHQKYAVRIGNDFDVYSHVLQARLFDRMGFGSKRVTEKFIEWVKEYDPDVIHLHNIHGYYINIEVLFNYLKTCGKRIIWTLHDCWAFTGHCAFFDYVGCNKWKTGCEHCSQKTEYPARVGIDGSKRNYGVKKELFSGVHNLTIVTPSEWLAKLLKESFLAEYPVKVIKNGINTSIFKNTKSNIKERFGISEDKKIVLGVASVWDSRKGLEDFLKLSKLLDDKYKIVLIGLNKKQIEKLPNNILGIERTENIQELVAWYSVADVFVNPTYEDNYPTTNLESIACGTPVITYDTGGSGESAKIYGNIIKKKDVNSLYKTLVDTQTIIRKDCNLDYRFALEQYLVLYG